MSTRASYPRATLGPQYARTLLPDLSVLETRGHTNIPRSVGTCPIVNMKKPKAGGGYKGKGFNGLGKRTADGPKAARAERAPEKPVNPFERKPSSKKHDVLGRVRGDKAAAKSVAKARSEAWETRKKTLGVEARQDGKSNSFLDRRFGEQDDVTEEDKMLMRFQRERMARIKKGAFDLDEDEEDILTHKGQLLGAMTKDDFSAEILKSHCLIGMY